MRAQSYGTDYRRFEHMQWREFVILALCLLVQFFINHTRKLALRLSPWERTSIDEKRGRALHPQLVSFIFIFSHDGFESSAVLALLKISGIQAQL